MSNPDTITESQKLMINRLDIAYRKIWQRKRPAAHASSVDIPTMDGVYRVHVLVVDEELYHKRIKNLIDCSL